MAEDRPITPAPKPSQRTTRKAKTEQRELAANTEVIEGVVVLYTEAELRTDAVKRKKLLESPDGAPGKDLALHVQAEIERDKRVAPIVASAVKDVKTWVELHGKAAKVTKAIADKLVQIRVLFEDKDGYPDMRGSSNGYREAAASIYQRAGIDADSVGTIQGTVRYHLSESLRTVLKTDERFAGGDEQKYLELCERYKINPQSALEKQRRGRNEVRAGTRLPALSLPDDTAALWKGVAQYAHKALEAPGDAIPTDLPEDTREALREELEAVRDRAVTLLAWLGDE